MWIHAQYNDNPALIFEAHTISYAEMQEKIGHMMLLLNSNQLTGMRMAIDLPDSFTLIQWTIANWNVGNCVMLLDQRLKPSERAWRVADYAPDMIMTSLTSTAGGIQPFQPEVPVQIQDYNIERRYETDGKQETDKDDPMLLVMYSSGSTGIPKRIIRSASSIQAELSQYSGEPHAPEAGSRVLCLAPLTHAYGLLSACLHTLYAGGTVYIPPVLRPLELARLIEAHAITHVFGVQFHYQLLEKAWRHADPPVKPPICVCSGGPLSHELADRYRRLGIRLTEQYGMSEVGYIAVDFTGRASGSVGPIADHHRWRIDDEGQLVLELPRNPYGTSQANWISTDEGGLLETQDLVSLDELHHLTVIGRMNRQVSIGGLKVNLEEIELQLNGHPHIAQCCVVDNAHPVYGTYLEAFIVWNHRGEVPIPELKNWLAAMIADYKIPRMIHVVPDIPTSPSGKILRGELMKGSPNDYQTTG